MPGPISGMLPNAHLRPHRRTGHIHRFYRAAVLGLTMLEARSGTLRRFGQRVLGG